MSDDSADIKYYTNLQPLEQLLTGAARPGKLYSIGHAEIPVRKELREHLQRQIDQHGLDMTHITERVGSPKTFVCKKDRRNYRRRCDEYRDDMKALASLAAMAGKTARDGERMERIARARERAAAWEPI